VDRLAELARQRDLGLADANLQSAQKKVS